MSGYGVFTHFSGDKYEGEFKSNQRHGKGKQTYKNGSVYEGLFEKDVAMEEARGKMVTTTYVSYNTIELT